MVRCELLVPFADGVVEARADIWLRREMEHRSAFSLRADEIRRVVIFSFAEREEQCEGDSQSQEIKCRFLARKNRGSE